MKKIRIEFQDENSTEFKAKLPGALTHRDFLVVANELHSCNVEQSLPGDIPIIEVEIGNLVYVRSTVGILDWRLHLVADEFSLFAQHIFFTQQNQAMMAAARKQIVVPQARLAVAARIGEE